MRAVVQRASAGRVAIQGAVVATIGSGAVVLLGVARGDTAEDARWMAEKLSRLRIFEDADGRMNEDIARHGNAFLLVSQFTLLGDARRGNRPGFTAAAPPEEAAPLCVEVARLLRAHGHGVHTGVFGADMQVTIENDGPVTILLDSRPDA
jgi:D-aminoacyl-tRNA deacylase